MRVQRKHTTATAVQWKVTNLREVQDAMAPDSPLTMCHGERLMLSVNETATGFAGKHDWIVKIRDGHYEVLSPEEFAATYEPVTTDNEH